jgi:hypothetical protein
MRVAQKVTFGEEKGGGSAVTRLGTWNFKWYMFEVPSTYVQICFSMIMQDHTQV